MAETKKEVCSAKIDEHGKKDEKQKTEAKQESIETLLRDMHVLQKIVSFLKYFAQFLFLWLLGWLGFSYIWVFIAAIGYYIVKTRQERRDWKQKVGQALAQDEEVVIRARLGDLPSWVSIFYVQQIVHLFCFSNQTFLVAKQNFKIRCMLCM
jgi:hypothetical protein